MGIWGRRGKLRIFLRQQQLHCQYFSFCSKRVKKIPSLLFVHLDLSSIKAPSYLSLVRCSTHTFLQSFLYKCVHTSIQLWGNKFCHKCIFSLLWNSRQNLFQHFLCSFIWMVNQGLSYLFLVRCSSPATHLPTHTSSFGFVHTSTRPFNWVPFLW